MKQLFFSIVLLLITTTGLFASGTDAKGGQQLPAEIKAISAYALQVVGNPASTGTDAPIGTLAIDAVSYTHLDVYKRQTASVSY